MTGYTYETILVEIRGRVGWITLNRPEALNALNSQVMHDTVAAASAFDADPRIGAIVVTGSERAFAAGADVKEMEPRSGLDMAMDDPFAAGRSSRRSAPLSLRPFRVTPSAAVANSR